MGVALFSLAVLSEECDGAGEVVSLFVSVDVSVPLSGSVVGFSSFLSVVVLVCVDDEEDDFLLFVPIY